MRRRHLIFSLIGISIQSKAADAQMSQRARQIRDRKACEQNLPTCKPGIRAQLDLERTRQSLWLGGLGVIAIASIGLLYIRGKRLRAASRGYTGKADTNGPPSGG